MPTSIRTKPNAVNGAAHTDIFACEYLIMVKAITAACAHIRHHDMRFKTDNFANGRASATLYQLPHRAAF